MVMDKEYGFLRAARVIFKVLAWVVLAMFVLVGFVTLGVKETALAPEVPIPPKITSVMYLVMGGLYWLVSYTISEIIGILLDIKGSSEKSEG